MVPDLITSAQWSTLIADLVSAFSTPMGQIVGLTLAFAALIGLTGFIYKGVTRKR